MAIKSENVSAFYGNDIRKLVNAHAARVWVEDHCVIFDSGAYRFETNQSTYYHSVCLISFNTVLVFIFRTIGGKSLIKFQEISKYIITVIDCITIF